MLLLPSSHIFRYNPQRTTCVKQITIFIYTKPSMTTLNHSPHKPPSSQQHFKSILNDAYPDFAWEVMMLQISLQKCKQLAMDDVMRLIQLYMLGVQVLQNEDDLRYQYFNDKIHSLMMRKTVMQQLHRAATGHAPDPQTIQMATQRQLQNLKSQHQLQVFLQKDQYTFKAITQILKKQQKHLSRKGEKIKRELNTQRQTLQQRIQTRRLRSISGSKTSKKSSGNLPSPSHKIISKASYSYTPEEKEGEREEAQVVRFWASPPKPKHVQGK